jgi:hypothetical protein
MHFEAGIIRGWFILLACTIVARTMEANVDLSLSHI